MKELLETRLKHWYLPLILGIISIILGIVVFRTPMATFLTIAVFFSFGFMISGIVEAVYAFINRKELDIWGWYLALGILTFIVGLQLIMRPDLSVMLLTLYIGFWLLFRSIMYISSAIDLKRLHSSNWGWVLAFGILGVIFSFLLLWNPIATSITVSIWIGFGLISLGILQLILAISMRKIKKKVKEYEEDIQVFE